MAFLTPLRRVFLGRPKDVRDPHAFHRMSLVALLAWVGLGADGLSSSAYGPDEAWRTLGGHTGLAVFIALAMAVTVLLISTGYSRIIEHFPGGGGGYMVATRLLSPRTGVVSGAALLVDYVLTITTSLAAGADAIFSFLPVELASYKLAFAFGGLFLLTILNLRGVKESVAAIAPVFGLFVITHFVLLAVIVCQHFGDFGPKARAIGESISGTARSLGIAGTFHLLLRAYALGGGTYTGIEAVSNGVTMMREPRVATAQRTMRLMAVSLIITASGILVSYLLVDARPVAGQTMNAVLLNTATADWRLFGWSFGGVFSIVALLSEGALLFVAAQAGFLDGPRVMANMASDSWLPHRFSALSERLTMRNGVVLMATAAALTLIYTGGDVSKLIVMYSINVFLTFLLSNLAMAKLSLGERTVDRGWRRHFALHSLTAVLCAAILCVTLVEKFRDGGWVTLVVTSLVVVFCFQVRRHYERVRTAIFRLDKALPGHSAPPVDPALAPDPSAPVVILFVGGYSGLGRHALLTCLRMFPSHFRGVVFLSVAVADSGVFKGQEEVLAVEARARESLRAYEDYARTLGLGAASDCVVGTEVPIAAETLARQARVRFPRGLVVAGQVIFDDQSLWSRLLHNETAFLIQSRLQHAGIPMIVVPVRLGRLDRSAPRGSADATRGSG